MRTPKRIPLSRQTADLIEEDIISGKWTGALPGYRKLCDYYQVGRHTITSALNTLTKRGILTPAEGTRARRINENVSKTNKQLQRGRKSLVILTAVDRSHLDTTTRRILKGVTITLAEEGWETHYEATKEVATKPGDHIANLTSLHPNSRWILLMPSLETIDWFADNNQRAICLGGQSTTKKLPILYVSLSYILAISIKHLTQHRHKNISCFLGNYYDDTLTEAYANIYKQHGLTFNRNYNLPPVADLNPAELFSRFQSVFSVTPPTAVIIQTQEILLSFLSFCNHQGLRVPQDVSILLADNIPHASWMHPRPTYIDWPVERFVKNLVPLLRSYPHGNIQAKTLQPIMIENDSVRTLGSKMNF